MRSDTSLYLFGDVNPTHALTSTPQIKTNQTTTHTTTHSKTNAHTQPRHTQAKQQHPHKQQTRTRRDLGRTAVSFRLIPLILSSHPASFRIMLVSLQSRPVSFRLISIRFDMT